MTQQASGVSVGGDNAIRMELADCASSPLARLLIGRIRPNEHTTLYEDPPDPFPPYFFQLPDTRRKWVWLRGYVDPSFTNDAVSVSYIVRCIRTFFAQRYEHRVSKGQVLH